MGLHEERMTSKERKETKIIKRRRAACQIQNCMASRRNELFSDAYVKARVTKRRGGDDKCGMTDRS